MENNELLSNFYLSVQEATIEILGRHEAEKIFDSVVGSDQKALDDRPELSVDLLTGICNEFSIQYYLNTARGLLLRIGDAAFLIMRRKIEKLNALGSIENRLRPFDKKFEISLQALSELLSRVLEIPVKLVTTREKCFCLHLTTELSSVSGEGLNLYFIAGILRAFGTWLDSRRDYQVSVQMHTDHLEPDVVCLCVLPAH